MTGEAALRDRCAPSETNWPVRQHKYPRGVELFTQGGLLRDAMQIVTGTVKLLQSNRSGAEGIIGLAFAGEWIGTAPIVARKATPVSAVTCSPAEIRCVPAEQFREQLERDARLSCQIHQSHALELCRQASWIGQLCSLSSRQRLAHTLARFAVTLSDVRRGSAIEFELPLYRRELAELIAVTPEYLSRLLKDMRREGLIEQRRRRMIIPDVRRLADVEDEQGR